MSNPPTPREEFEELTGLMPQLIAEAVVSRPEDACFVETLTKEELQWFCQHADKRLRYLHANKKAFKRKLAAAGDAGRDCAYVWIEHWWPAFMRDKVAYIARQRVFDEEASCES